MRATGNINKYQQAEKLAAWHTPSFDLQIGENIWQGYSQLEGYQVPRAIVEQNRELVSALRNNYAIMEGNETVDADYKNTNPENFKFRRLTEGEISEMLGEIERGVPSRFKLFDMTTSVSLEDQDIYKNFVTPFDALKKMDSERTNSKAAIIALMAKGSSRNDGSLNEDEFLRKLQVLQVNSAQVQIAAVEANKAHVQFVSQNAKRIKPHVRERDEPNRKIYKVLQDKKFRDEWCKGVEEGRPDLALQRQNSILNGKLRTFGRGASKFLLRYPLSTLGTAGRALENVIESNLRPKDPKSTVKNFLYNSLATGLGVFSLGYINVPVTSTGKWLVAQKATNFALGIAFKAGITVAAFAFGGPIGIVPLVFSGMALANEVEGLYDLFKSDKTHHKDGAGAQKELGRLTGMDLSAWRTNPNLISVRTLSDIKSEGQKKPIRIVSATDSKNDKADQKQIEVISSANNNIVGKQTRPEPLADESAIMKQLVALRRELANLRAELEQLKNERVQLRTQLDAQTRELNELKKSRNKNIESERKTFSNGVGGYNNNNNNKDAIPNSAVASTQGFGKDKKIHVDVFTREEIVQKRENLEKNFGEMKTYLCETCGHKYTVLDTVMESILDTKTTTREDDKDKHTTPRLQSNNLREEEKTFKLIDVNVKEAINHTKKRQTTNQNPIRLS